MAAGTALLCSSLLFVHVFVPAEPKIITAKSGQDVTLTCRAPNISITGVKWSRNHLEPENIFLYQDGRFDPDNQHPFFKNRVDLQDRQMKDGDVSLILKDVTIIDTGTYVCGVFTEGADLLNLITMIDLSVVPPDQKTITAESGQDVILPCRARKNNIEHVEWKRADLKTENVFFRSYCDIILDGQHPSFKNRVDLQDRQMKDGDVSLILKDVTINDAGTYDCGVSIEEAHIWDHSTIHLHVVPPGKSGGDRDEL